MNKSEEAARTNAAVLAQLNAEISASGHNVKSFAAALAVDYNTFRRYLVADRELPSLTLWAALEVLGVPINLFGARVLERASQVSGG